MLLVSATDLAIATADKAGTLRLAPAFNQRLADMGLAGEFVTISDDVGLIEVADDMAQAERRVDAIRERVRP